MNIIEQKETKITKDAIVFTLEQEMIKTYGHQSIINPEQIMDSDDIRSANEQIKKIEQKQNLQEVQSDIYQRGNIKLLSNSKLKHKLTYFQNCDKCGKNVKTIVDDITINKYGCCENCYVKHIQGTKAEKIQKGEHK